MLGPAGQEGNSARGREWAVEHGMTGGIQNYHSGNIFFTYKLFIDTELSVAFSPKALYSPTSWYFLQGDVL